MNYTEIIAISSVALIIAAALFYIIRAKRKGQKCIGCPYSSSCKGGCGCTADPTPKKQEK